MSNPLRTNEINHNAAARALFRVPGDAPHATNTTHAYFASKGAPRALVLRIPAHHRTNRQNPIPNRLCHHHDGHLGPDCLCHAMVTPVPPAGQTEMRAGECCHHDFHGVCHGLWESQARLKQQEERSPVATTSAKRAAKSSAPKTQLKLDGKGAAAAKEDAKPAAAIARQAGSDAKPAVAELN